MGLRGWRAATSTDTAVTIRITAACNQAAPVDLWTTSPSGTRPIPSGSAPTPNTIAVIGEAKGKPRNETSVGITFSPASGCASPTEIRAVP